MVTLLLFFIFYVFVFFVFPFLTVFLYLSKTKRFSVCVCVKEEKQSTFFAFVGKIKEKIHCENTTFFVFDLKNMVYIQTHIFVFVWETHTIEHSERRAAARTLFPPGKK